MPFPPQQTDFPSLNFDGRQVLYVSEVAAKLKITERHVLDLIEEGKLTAVNISAASDTRKNWRIPVEAFNRFVRENLNLYQP